MQSLLPLPPPGSCESALQSPVGQLTYAVSFISLNPKEGVWEVWVSVGVPGGGTVGTGVKQIFYRPAQGILFRGPLQSDRHAQGGVTVSVLGPESRASW